MKPGTRPRGEHRRDERTWDAECSEPARHVDPIGAPKRFDQRHPIWTRGRDLMVIHDHCLDLGDPVCVRAGREMLARERNGRRNVVERVVRPYPKIVKHCSDSDLFELDPIASSRDRETQVHHPIHVVAIGDEVAPQRRRMIAENRVDGRDARVYHATLRWLAVNRLTNSSAFSATSRQPASIVSACPRPGILTISVTPWLRFCFL